MSDKIYRIANGDDWKIQEWDEFNSGTGIDSGNLPDWHALMSGHPDWFEVLRCLYGINPVFGDEEDRPKIASIEGLSERFKVSEEAIEAVLVSAKEAWVKHVKSLCGDESPHDFIEPPKRKRGRPKKIQATDEKKGATPEAIDASDLPDDVALPVISGDERKIIAELGFNMSMFSLPGRGKEAEIDEIKWFANRLTELRRMFEEPMAQSLARQALVNEILLRRCDEEMLLVRPDSDLFKDLHATKRKMETAYDAQWARLEEICPYIRNLQNKVNFAGTVSEIIDAYYVFKKDNRNDLIDGFFTAYGIQIQMRASKQVQEPPYRPGQVAAINEAKAAITDPKFVRRLPNYVCRALDEGFRQAFAKMVEQGVIKLVDLEKTGPAGEWPELFDPPTDEEVESATESEVAPLESDVDDNVIPQADVDLTV